MLLTLLNLSWACRAPCFLIRQLGGGIDFASTGLRVNFNDLQPDRVFPQERFYVVSKDGRLLLLTLGSDEDDEGSVGRGEGDCPPVASGAALEIETLWDIQPPLQTGEIVSVCGCGEMIVSCMCARGGACVHMCVCLVCVCTTGVWQVYVLAP